MANRLIRLMERHQRRGTCSVDRHARPTQIELIRDTVGRNTGGIAGHRRCIQRRQVVGPPVRIVGPGESQVNRASTAPHAGWTNTAALERFPGQLQQQALLRVHLLGLTWRNTEKCCIEAGNITERTRGERVACTRLRLARVKVGILRPPVFRHLTDQIPTVTQALPKAIRIRARKAEAVSNDCDSFFHPFPIFKL